MFVWYIKQVWKKPQCLQFSNSWRCIFQMFGENIGKPYMLDTGKLLALYSSQIHIISHYIPFGDWHSIFTKPGFWQFLWLKNPGPASLVAQWLRICLPMQGTRVRALVCEDPTCRGANGPMSHNYWACGSGACAPQQERPATREATIVRGPCTAMKSGPHLPQLEKALAQKRRPNTAKNK